MKKIKLRWTGLIFLSVLFVENQTFSDPPAQPVTEAPLPETKADQFNNQKLLSHRNLFENQAWFSGPGYSSKTEFLKYSKDIYGPGGTEGRRVIHKKGDLRIPQSASYLPEAQGPATEVKDLLNGVPRLLNKKVVLDNGGQTLLDRFFKARRKIYGYSGQWIDAQEEAIRKTYSLHKDAESWNGYCMNWTGAFSQLEFNELLKAVKGVVCDGILLEEGGVRNLFVMLSDIIGDVPDSRVNTDTVGDDKKYSKYLPQRQKILDSIGLSDVSPRDMEAFILNNLKENRGFGIEVQPNREKWNHPVYKATVEEKVLSSNAEIAEFLDKIPPQHLEVINGWDFEAKWALNDLIDAQQKLIDTANAMPNTVPLIGDMLNWMKFSWGFDQDLEKRRQALIKLEKAMKEGRLRVADNESIKVKKMTVSYAVENEYGKTDDFTVDVPYYYGSVVKDGFAVDSFWLSPEQKSDPDQSEQVLGGRPDFLWMPPQIDEAYNIKHPLADLVSFLSTTRAERDPLRAGAMPTDRCMNLSDMLELEVALKPSPQPRAASDAEKAHIINLVKASQLYLNIPELEKMVRESNINNLSIQEIRAASN